MSKKQACFKAIISPTCIKSLWTVSDMPVFVRCLVKDVNSLANSGFCFTFEEVRWTGKLEFTEYQQSKENRWSSYNRFRTIAPIIGHPLWGGGGDPGQIQLCTGTYRYSGIWNITFTLEVGEIRYGWFTTPQVKPGPLYKEIIRSISSCLKWRAYIDYLSRRLKA